MNSYLVLVEGRGFSMRLDGKLVKGGFFTTFKINADRLNDVKAKVLESLNGRIQSNSGVFAVGKNRPYFVIKKISDDPSVVYRGLESGFSFYKMSLMGSFNAKLSFLWSLLLCRIDLRDSLFCPVYIVVLEWTKNKDTH